MRVSYLWLARAFFLLLGVQKEEYSGVFIAENAHRCRNPTLLLQEKCSMGYGTPEIYHTVSKLLIG